MDESTHDEPLADAIAYAALDLLDRLADTPEARSRFLRELLGLMARYGSREAAEIPTATSHWLSE